MESSAPAPRISLVVCTTGRPDRMPGLTRQLSAVLDDAAGLVEVLVVDNSRSSGLAIADPRVQVVPSPVPGLSRARTTACMHARGEVVVFTDDDVDFASDWARRMAQPVLDGRADATAAPVRLGPEFDGIRSVLVRQWLAEANLDGTVRLVGAGMALHRRLLEFAVWDERIGAGRPDFAFGEETLVEYQLRSAGARLDLAADAEVIHHPDLDRTTPDHLRRMARQKGLSDAYLGYHWSGESLPRPRLRATRRRLRLALYRRSHRAAIAAGPGLDEELRLVESLGRAEGFVRLTGEPRRYLPRPTAAPA